MRRHALCVALAALGASAASAVAAPDDEAWRKAIEAVQQQMREMAQKYEARISGLEKQLAEKGTPPSELQVQIDDLVDRVDEVDGKLAVRASGPGLTRFVEISLNSLFTTGTSTAPEDVIDALQGGGHDPKKRGFTVQNTELVLTGAVDPYFRAQLNLLHLITAEGETAVELEEAFATTTSLPAGLQVKAGQFFTEFGRLNPQHPHQWEFVDQPVVNTRFLGGDGMRGPGARVSWLAPTGFPLEVIVGAQNANGETMVSFLGTEEEEPPFGAHVERMVRTWEDLVWTGRVAASVDATEELPLLFGVSGALGPSGATTSGNASILGVDFTAKWKPLANDRGFPFVSFQTEWMRRHFGYDSFVADGTFVPGGELQDAGGYAQLVWGFQRDWTLGLRYDKVRGCDDRVLGLDDRNRWSVALTFYTSEFAKLRLQVNRDDSAALDGRETSVWLQFEFNLGTHGAHKF
jgi:hypothetical protein